MSTDVTSVTKSLDRIADALEGQSGGGFSEGGSNEPIVITGTYAGEYDLTETLDKTWQEIYDNFLAGKIQIVKIYAGGGSVPENRVNSIVLGVQNTGHGGDYNYQVFVLIGGGQISNYSCGQADGYPSNNFNG